MADKELVYLPLGGTGEIGMNCNLYGYGHGEDKRWIMVDLGVMFADNTTPGIDRLVPDLQFIEARAHRLVGLLLTHGHEDHIGAVANMWQRLQCPIYATPFTAELLRDKFFEVGLDLNNVPLHIVALGGRVELDCFTIDYVQLTHSIAESYALAISCGGHRIVHSGDWKIDPDPIISEGVDEQQLRALGDAGVDALICDSTNALDEGRAGSETVVAQNLTEVIRLQKGRVVVTSFASNVARLHSLGEAARICGRDLCLLGRSMWRIFCTAQKSGYLKNFPTPLNESNIRTHPRDKLLVICTGSQGEENAALSRIADGSHRQLRLEKDDSVIFSSRVIPGNARAIVQLQNRLLDAGVDVITADEHGLHSSGHPCRDDLRDMYDWLRPRASVPTHGETRHLRAHEALARQMQIAEPCRIKNGDILRLAPAPSKVIGRAPHGRRMLDGRALIDNDDIALITRRSVIREGLVLITLVVDHAGKLCAAPETMLLGIPEFTIDGENIHQQIYDAIDTAFVHQQELQQTIKKRRQKIAHLVKRIWGKYPKIKVTHISVN